MLESDESVRVARTAGAAPTVLFCNGLGETLDFWHPVLTRLAGIATFEFDRPGERSDPTGSGARGRGR